MVSRAVYTALIGTSEAIRRPSTVESWDPAIDRILLTDRKDIDAPGWDVHVVVPEFQHDPVRSARLLKILGHELVARYDQTLWIDNRVDLLQDPTVLFDGVLGCSDIALPLHSFRETLNDEFRAVLRYGYDDPRRVREQWAWYAASFPQLLEVRPFWSAILLRASSPKVDNLMRTWANHVLRYSRRDQLSLPVALGSSQVRVQPMEVNNLQSEFHAWVSESDAGRASGVLKWRSEIAGNPNYEFVDQVYDQLRATRRMAASSFNRVRELASK